jgi:hypothetical protein
MVKSQVPANTNYGIDQYTKFLLRAGDATANLIKDWSGYARTLTVNGNTTGSTTKTKLNPYSVYFDGSSALSLPLSSTDFAMGTGDLTIDFWAYQTVATGLKCAIGFGGASSVIEIGLFIRADNNSIDLRLHDGQYLFTTYTPSAGSWFHVAITRSGTSLRCFINGQQLDATKTSSDNVLIPSAYCQIGANNATYYFTGYIDEFRISKGIALWTANFQPPTRSYVHRGW